MAERALPVVDRFEQVDALPGTALVRLFGRGDLEGRAAALVLAAGGNVHRYRALPGTPQAGGWPLAFAVPSATLEAVTAMAVDLGSAGTIPLAPPTGRSDREALLATEARLTITEDRLAGVEHALADREQRLAQLGRQAARRGKDAGGLERRLAELRSRLAERIEHPSPAPRNGPPEVDMRIVLAARRGAAAAEELESRVRRLHRRLEDGHPG